jgi:hypothetical protein
LVSSIQCATTLHNSLLYMREHTCTHTHTHKSVHCHVFISCCLVAASNGGHSLSSGFPNYPRPQLPASNSNSSQRLNYSGSLTNSVTLQPANSTQLTLLLITTRHRPHRKHAFSIAIYGPLPSIGRCLVVCFAVVA